MGLSNAVTQACTYGDLTNARKLLADYEALLKSYPDPRGAFNLAQLRGQVAMAEGRAAQAVAHCTEALRHTEASEAHIGSHIAGLANLTEAQLANGRPRLALQAARKAAQLHRAHGLQALDGLDVTYLWWQHHRALAANGRADEAWAALQQAYALLLDGVKNVRDEGLRRSFLNKVPQNRAITLAWLKQAASRGLGDDERLAHLRLPSDVGEPFKRLVDTGVRLNEIRSANELQDFLIEELLELSGAERVLLVLDGVDGLSVGGAQLPVGEQPATLRPAADSSTSSTRSAPLSSVASSTRNSASSPASRSSFRRRPVSTRRWNGSRRLAAPARCCSRSLGGRSCSRAWASQACTISRRSGSLFSALRRRPSSLRPATVCTR
jgi:hypothetical protein